VPAVSSGRDEYSRRQFLTWLGGVSLVPLLGPFLSAESAWASGHITVLTGATVIDGTGAPARGDQAVVLVGERIAWVGPRSQLPPTDGARVIELSGKYVMPGLCDMHTHFGFDELLTIPLHIANGVTSVREMWGFPEIHAVRNRINSGQLLGPHFTIASNIIDGAHSIWAPDATEVVTAEEGRQAARDAKDAGADFIKIYSFLREEAFRGLNDEARRLGIPVAGHAPAPLSVRMLTHAGMRSFEHLYGMPMATSTYEQKYLKQLNDTPVDPANRRAYVRLFLELDRQASLHHNPGKARALYERMARQNAWQSPTLTVNRVLSVPPATFANDPRLKYIPQYVQDSWVAFVNRAAPQTPEQIAQQAAYLEFRLDMVGRMAAAGVGILGGSDTPNPYVFPGFAAHDELALLVEAGLSPMGALLTMTGDAARFLRREADIGTVRMGRYADLIVLDADPLADIRNTQRIHAICVRGRMITAAEREQMLADIEASANFPFATASSLSVGMPLGRACGCH
jgi:imidazolonepropionase-like amidohydrolase